MSIFIKCLPFFVPSKEILRVCFIRLRKPFSFSSQIIQFQALRSWQAWGSLCRTGESQKDKFICFEFQRHPRECLLFITVLTLNVVSDFSVLSLLSVPSRFSAPPRETLGSWSYLSIKAEVSSRRLSLSSGVSRRCLYLGPTNGNALTLLQAVVSIQQVPWTAKYYSQLHCPQSGKLNLRGCASLQVELGFTRHWAPLMVQEAAQHSIGTGSTRWPFNSSSNLLVSQTLCPYWNIWSTAFKKLDVKKKIMYNKCIHLKCTVFDKCIYP